MLKLIFSVYDEKAEIYTDPFHVPTEGLAVRAFKDCINSESHQFGKHPADYTLFKLGTFDDNACKYSIEQRKMMGNGVEFLNPDHVSAFEDFANGPPDPPVFPNQNG